MSRNQTFVVLACAVALLAGCAKNNKKMAANNLRGKTTAAASNKSRPTTAPSAAAAAAPAPAVATDKLAGAFQLAIPRRNQQAATIAFTDATHVTINAGETLSGNYLVQGSYLLILTHDQRLKPLAWRINSPDSLTVVRSPELENGSAYIGATLVRSPSTATTEMQSTADEDEAAADIAEMFGE